MKRWHWVVVSFAVAAIVAMLSMTIGSHVLFGPRHTAAPPSAAARITGVPNGRQSA